MSGRPIRVASKPDAGDAYELLPLVRRLESLGGSLHCRLGSRYEELLEQAKTAIIISSISKGLSPVIAAVRLGVSGDLAALVGDEEDAFSVLIQAALQISSPGYDAGIGK